MDGAGNYGFRSALAVAIVLVAGERALAQGGVTWQQLTPTNSPSARFGHSMVYDSARQRLVLFGGEDVRGARLADTWEWDGANWLRRSPAQSPSPRSRYGMAYDPGRQRVVLNGGDGPGAVPIADTWEWDGNNWMQSTPATNPVGVTRNAMVYDPSRQRVLMFGGLDAANIVHSQTWEWDGVNWMQLMPAMAPTARQGHAMVHTMYPSSRILLFGGQDGVGSRLQDTWEWDGVNWTPRTTFPTPASRFRPTMMFDASRHRTILYAGIDSSSVVLGDTWEWDGGWNPLSPTVVPPTRVGHASAYHVGSGQALVFGGFMNAATVLADTWELASLSPASFTGYGSGCGGSQGVPSLGAAPSSLPWTGDVFSVVVGNLPAGSLPFMVVGFAQTSIPIPVLPGCTRLSSAEAVVALSLGGGTATWSQAVPASPGLVGLSLFLQGAALNAGGMNVFGAALSNGGQLTVGMR